MSGARGGAGWLAVVALAAACGLGVVRPPALPTNDELTARAAAAPRGVYPRWALGEQTYWTVVGADGDDAEALVSGDGLVEVVPGGWTLEPFVEVDGRLVTWADVTATVSLADGVLPVPSVSWRHAAFALDLTAFADGPPGATILYVRYRLTPVRDDVTPRLWIALRPLQVLPPWQDLNVRGGVGALPPLVARGRTVAVGRRTLVSTPAPSARRPLALEAPSLGSFALGYAPGRAGEPLAVDLAVPLHDGGRTPALPAAPAAGATVVDRRLAETLDAWRARLGGPVIRLPPAAGDAADVVSSTLGYVRVHRDGAALHPGSRTYERAWIRDGALTSSMLLAFGQAEPVREFLLWYAGHQFPDGRVPCCIDGRGADPTPEYDSDGEFIYAVGEYWRFTHDRATLARLWPHVVRAADHIEQLRAQRLVPAYAGTAVYGLVPESISHEGYHRKAVHSYWDDFFALRGLGDAAALAAVLGDAPAARRYRRAHADFARALGHSLARVIRDRRLDYVPGSVELADFDPTSTAVALTVANAAEVPPAGALRATFARYHAEIARWRAGRPDREGYTPYEARNADALVRLGERAAAFDVFTFVLRDRRPPGWQQWGEVVWDDPAAPRFIGDMPHTWAAQAVVMALRTMLVYEREDDAALVVAAGVPRAWLDDAPGVAVERLPTHYGPLDYRLERTDARTVRLTVAGGLSVPPGGLVLAPPVRRGAPARIDERPVAARPDGAVLVRHLPVVVTWDDPA